jgi:outer membrane protein/adhesin transport system outer membrane protein
MMRTSFWLSSSIAVIAGLAGAAPAFAQSIDDVMGLAYTQNTQLGGARAQQRATDEQVPQALSNWRPTVTVSGGGTWSHSGYNPPSLAARASHPLDPTAAGYNSYNTETTMGVQVTEHLYRGGRTVAQTSQAVNTVKSGQAQLKNTEQTVLLAAAQSYLDVVRDQATVELTANNEAVLKRQLDAETDRFRVGEVTRTDVALSQASYQQARAQHQTAIGQLSTDRATFQRVVGQAPQKLVQPPFKYPLPASLEEAVSQAEELNPGVISAVYAERAARDNVDVAQGARLPQVDLVGTVQRVYPGRNSELSAASSTSSSGVTQGRGFDHLDVGSVAVQGTWPIYTGGLASSQVREAKQTANQNLIAIEEAKRAARQAAISAWEQLQTSRANIEALTAQVKAAAIGAEGTRQQALVGTSTVLDSLTAEQQLLQAQVNLVSAQHDELVNSYTLLSAVGGLTARDMHLNVTIYDPQVNQDRVGDKWFGTGID